MKNFFMLFTCLAGTIPLIGQSTNCSDAAMQLQNYAAQVNQIYNYEYFNGIPNQRCPAMDAWGRPFNPQVVQNCRWQMLNNLNQWYGQQSNYVNSVYAQIARTCTQDNSGPVGRPAPGRIEGDEQNSEIDTDQIEELTAGVDEDKAVRIRIPSTASGFKPRN